MEDLPCKGCNGMCCGPVPVTEQELKIIKKKVKSMPKKAGWIWRSSLEILEPACFLIWRRIGAAFIPPDQGFAVLSGIIRLLFVFANRKWRPKRIGALPTNPLAYCR